MNGPYHKQESPIGFITCRDIRSEPIVLSFFISIVSTRRVIDFIFDRKPWSSNLSHDLHYASMTSDNSFRISRISELYILQGRHQEGAGGASAPPPNLWQISHPYLNQEGGGQIMPTTILRALSGSNSTWPPCVWLVFKSGLWWLACSS